MSHCRLVQGRAQQRDALLRMGCHHYQGYLVSKPLDESAFAAWSAARRTG